LPEVCLRVDASWPPPTAPCHCYQDADGVVVVGREQAAHVLEASCERERDEAEWRAHFRAGVTSWSASGFDEIARELGLSEEERG